MNRVLIIDDDFTLGEGLCSVLALEGFEAMYAMNGVEGVALAQQHQPHVILCDLQMPRCDGLGVLRWLNVSLHTSNIPVIMYTAQTDAITLRLCKALGAYGYLTKPSPIPDILAAIKGAINSGSAHSATTRSG